MSPLVGDIVVFNSLLTSAITSFHFFIRSRRNQGFHCAINFLLTLFGMGSMF